LPVIAGLFVSPLTALILLVYVLIYQQVEGNVLIALQPIIYNRTVQRHPLLIFVAVLIGRLCYWVSPACCWLPR
jgi:predicted PurR-regulated permease PerM